MIVRCRNYKFPFTWCWNDAAANDKNCVACVHKQRTQIRHSKSLSECVQMFDDSYILIHSMEYPNYICNLKIEIVFEDRSGFVVYANMQLKIRKQRTRNHHRIPYVIWCFHIYWSLSHPLKRPDFYFAFFVQTEICVTFLSKYFFIWFFFSILSRSNLIDM